MGAHKITGNWSIPGGKEFPGQLDVDCHDGKILLEIYSSVYMDGSIIRFMHDKVPHYLEYIWGQGSHMGRITLYECNWHGTSIIGEKLYVTKYRAKFKFLGLHFSTKNGPLILSGKFSFPNLGSFYDGWKSMKLRASDFDYNEINKNYSQKLIINSALELEFISYISGHVTEMNVSYSIEKYEYVIFHYKNEVPLSQLLKDAITFRKLLSFSFSQPTIHKIHSVEISHSQINHPIDTYKQTDRSYMQVTNFTMNQNKVISRDILHQNHMLLSEWKMSKPELNNVITKWFENTHLSNIYEYYLDSNNWFQGIKEATLSNVMFNNRFLNLIQGLEDYYREHLESAKTKSDRQQFDDKKKQVMSLIKDASLKKWLNDTFSAPQYAKLEEKLSAIVAHCTPVIHQAFTIINWYDFPGSAKEFRNQLSHGMNKEINQGEKLHLDYKLAQMLLCTCILQSLELQNLPKLITLNVQLRRIINEIQILQTVYPPT